MPPMTIIFDPRTLIHIQLELECIGVDADGHLHGITCDQPDDMARVFAAQHADEYTIYIWHDVVSSIVDQLRRLPPAAYFTDHDQVKRLLTDDPTTVTVEQGRSYIFERPPQPHEYANVIHEQDRFAIMVDGTPASWAWSSRSNACAAELAVETVPAFRRRGYAMQVASAWAGHQLAQGKVAFYSHKLGNVASQALAARLGVVHFIDWINYL